MTETVEIYQLSDPQTGEVRYVGKAICARRRLKTHLRDARRRDTPLYRWIRKLGQDGLVPVSTVIEVCKASDWRDREIAHIADRRSAPHRLLNVADGGDEPACSIEVRASNARKVTVSRVDTPAKAEIYRLKRTMGQLLRQGYVNEETKAKLRRAAVEMPQHFGLWANV